MQGLKLCFSRDQSLLQKKKKSKKRSNHNCHIVEKLIPSTRPNPLVLSVLCNTRMSLNFNLHRLQLISKQLMNKETIHQQIQIHTNIKQIRSKVNFQHEQSTARRMHFNFANPQIQTNSMIYSNSSSMITTEST